MRSPDARAHLFDIARACELIERFTQGRSLDDYEADAMLRSAVERQFEIAGEALKRVLAADGALATRISGSSRVIAFRNRLVHGYASVSNEVVWGIVERHLPTLRGEVEALLRELDSGAGA
jgi:uncharacterized protein with HEPN domain